MFRFFILIITACVVMGCKPQEPVAAIRPKSPLEKLVEQKLGADASIQKNRDESFALCKKAEDQRSKFIVVRMYDMQVVEEGAVTAGAIEWTGDYELEVSQALGQVTLERDKNSSIRKINLKKHLPTFPK